MVTEVIKDTVAVLDASKVAEFYADMLDKQQGQFNILLVVIGFIVTIVMGATWIWNHKFSKAQISEEIQAGLNNLNARFEEHRSTTKEEVASLVEEKMDELSASMKKELDSYKASISRENRKMKSDVCRVFALHCNSTKSYYNCATWWLAAFEEYVALDDGKFEQISIDAFVEALTNCEKNETIAEEQVESMEGLEKDIKSIPGVFTIQRNKALKLLKQIADKEKKAKAGKLK
ncbi:MAG: hypothetical protein LIR46_10475 [Bacteroidota bacterium]|nr:hypothetical protein [Bacteroidota bacterium]